MRSGKFFTQRTQSSEVKSNIVAKYFHAWATALKKQVAPRGNKLLYLDLFSGPGYYTERVKSTPIRILEAIIRDPDLCDVVSTLFNDADMKHCEQLSAAIVSLPGIDKLKYPPVVINQKVSQSLVDQLVQDHTVPTLLFLDPFGYKGLTIDLIWSVIRNWGCDCVFFFNYQRVNTGLPNPDLVAPINALFSLPVAEQLREKIKTLSVEGREGAIIEAITLSLQAKGGTYVQGFRFRSEKKDRTSHFLIFVSKNPLGLKLMKGIMGKESTSVDSEVPSFEFNLAQQRRQEQKKQETQMDLDLFHDQPDEIDELCDKLLVAFAGQQMTAIEVFYQHNVGTRYVESNYKNALLRLEHQGKITCTPPINERQKRNGKGTLGKDVDINFP